MKPDSIYMDDSVKKYLKDILTSINLIEDYLGEDKVFESYDNNSMLQDAVERNLEIIGEAVKNILIIRQDIAITNSRRIIDARNKISHGYDEIENVNIWSIIINHLPILKAEVENLLNS